MSMYIKTDVEGLVKDPNSGAILNVDNLKLDAYRKQKQVMEDRMRDKDRITKIESDINEIKSLLQAILRDK